MTVQLSVTVRNAQAAALEATVGVSPKLQIRSGAQPANCATAASGTLLAELPLPSDWLTAPSGGVVGLNGTWSDSSADAGGSAGHFRIVDNAGTTCHMQGSVTATGGGGDLTLSTVTVVSGQPVDVTSFTYTRGNA